MRHNSILLSIAAAAMAFAVWHLLCGTDFSSGEAHEFSDPQSRNILRTSQGLSTEIEGVSSQPARMGREQIALANSLSPPDAVTLQIRVVDARTGRGLESASLLSAEAPGSEMREIWHVASGTSQVPVEAIRGHRLYCQADGYARELISEGRSLLPAEMTVRLYASCQITGKVQLPRGDIAPTQMFVAIWPQSVSVPFKQNFAELSQNSDVGIVQCLQDGEFVVGGLREGVLYSAVAGGGGFSSMGAVEGLRAGTTDTVIQVVRLFGHLVRISGKHGAVLLNPGYGGRGYGTLLPSKEYSRAREISWTFPGVALNPELDSLIDECRSNPWLRLNLLLHQSVDGVPIDKIVGSSMRVALPGYAEARVTPELDWIALGLSATDLQLEETGNGWGSLRVEMPPTAAPLFNLKSARLVLLDAVANNEITFRAECADNGAHSAITWQGIPAGEYRAGLSSWIMSDVLTLCPITGPGNVTIVPGALQEAKLDFSDSVFVTISPEFDGRPYCGCLDVRWEPVDANGGGPQSRRYDSPPYTLPVRSRQAISMSIRAGVFSALNDEGINGPILLSPDSNVDVRVVLK